MHTTAPGLAQARTEGKMSGIPTPKFVLRGHGAAVHAASFVRQNARLATGDAEGFVVLWDLVVMRATAVWRAHRNAILGVRGWGDDKVMTHGRDHRLVVWKIAEQDESHLSSALPLEGLAVHRPQPWMLHLLEVNTMNFCSFAACPSSSTEYSRFLGPVSEVLVAVPNTLASEAVDIYTLPSQKRTHTVQPGSANGMAMGLCLFHQHGLLTLLAAFENGYVSVHQLQPTGGWATAYRARAHSQPVLSVDVRPDLSCFYSAGADSVIAKHPLPVATPAASPETPGPSSPAERVAEEAAAAGSQGASLLSQALLDEARGNRRTEPPDSCCREPRKVVNTRHAGQQSLQVRSDGGILATAGWDSKVRIYSCKTLKELAVLKWHKQGAYALAFSDVGAAEPRTAQAAGTGACVDQGRMSVMDRRSHRVKIAHWVAAGAKDGKVSLWDIY
ncbi:uncharacterized protein UV8b_00217 [Ustilaginoidea virens]|uniref:ASTRA-associated protein 1 n=1 Tax=Ustilaginoidea virens TaxID=1159556 RepID=A0A8E5MDD0_USTVR|nr:uncharacterized protein UV8b_00217 [Ustilaginoidea virens]QUC15976.1 hypothetical protein UV8b_00217 [Ustilaginoidea virens]